MRRLPFASIGRTRSRPRQAEFVTQHLLIILTTTLFVAGCAADEPETPGRQTVEVDTVLFNGRIFTVDEANPWAEAVAIVDKRIAKVGDDAAVMEMAGANTRRVDLAGRMVIPGLVDAHTHAGGMGRYAPPAQLDTSSREAIVASVAEHAEANPGLDWIEMCCWPVRMYDNGRTGPHKRELDRVVADRPVWLTSDIGHSIWVNSKALQLMGIDASTPDPHPGVSEYVRDAGGELTGWIKEKAYRQYRLDFFPVNQANNQAGMDKFLDYLRSYGVTTLLDAGNTYYSEEVYAYLAELDQAGNLPVRIEGTHHLFLPGQQTDAVARLRQLKDKYEGERLKFRTIKIHFDGSNENRTGAILEPYADDPGNRGDTVLRTDELRDLILQLHENNFDLHLHTVGDRAVRIGLDALESASIATTGQLNTRLTVSHLDIIDPADYARFRQLGVTAQYTPSWFGASFDDPVKVALGDARYARTLIARPLFDDGANVSFSSDITSIESIDYANPFLGMQIAYNRQYPQDNVTSSWGSADIRGPESERLPLEMIIRAYTLGGAYQLRMEEDLGSIEQGKLADLVVLDRNLFEIDRYEIQFARPDAVIMEGEIVSGSLE